MLPTRGYAVRTATSKLEPYQFERRDPGPDDILIDIQYCGICHSDIHQARDEWGGSIYPMVPGHEIIGRVTRAGSNVRRFKVGDLAGVGCFVDTCRSCDSCTHGHEHLCQEAMVFTYNGLEKDHKTPTYGGYSGQIVVDDKYAFHMPSTISPEGAAPLLCAGITTYSPLRQYNVGRGTRVAIVGLGGLGHMGVKFAVAMGADVTVLSTSSSKEKDARRLGAQHFAVTTDKKSLGTLTNSFDFILDCASAPHDLNLYLNMLDRDGVMVLVGVPPKSMDLSAFSLIRNRRRLAGSMLGGLSEIQQMLDYCGEKKIASDVEVIAMKDAEAAYERVIKGDVRYRFVIDMKTL